MPRYYLIARNGEETSSSRSYTHKDLSAFKRSASCYTFINELSNTSKNVGLGCRRRGRGLRDGEPPKPAAPAPAAAAPVAKPVAGFWPFTKKKPKRNPMSRRMIWEPGKPMRMLGRSRKRRRR